jgi:ABC-type hemin transport system ATPase subunit
MRVLSLRRALVEMFRGKCAYCESAIGLEGTTWWVDIDLFRPRADALGTDGRHAPDHYWWLALEWSNMYLACGDCSGAKGTRFPVLGKRAPAKADPGAIARERRLLLDPCVDHPEDVLLFGDDGAVTSGTRQGITTIEVLQLNRPRLVRARQAAAMASQALIEQIRETTSGATRRRKLIDQFLDPAVEYLALRRQLLARASVDEPSEPWATSSITSQEVAETQLMFKKTERDRSRYSVEDPRSESYYATTRHISRIEIENYKIIRNLTIDLATATAGGDAPWMVLLGENGSGKSSILEAVAMTLAGGKQRSRIGVSADDILRHRARRGSVVVHLTGGGPPVELGFDGSRGLRGSSSTPAQLLLGYGATRLLSRDKPAPRPRSAAVKVTNLFSPFVPLVDPTRWLTSLNAKTFNAMARALRALLPGEDVERIERHSGTIYVRAFGERLTLKELSAGYQSVVALATDMMQVLSSRWPSMELAEGIVLVDELEAHLHPTWKMRIVTALREVFPRVQFLASTHDPLCLRGVRNGEAVVLRRTVDEDVYALTDLPPVQGLRVEQLLTSEIFGLRSTSDPAVDDALGRYQQLLATSDRTADQRAELKLLAARLRKLQILGRDRRERLMLEAVDQYLGKERDVANLVERARLRDGTRTRIAELLAPRSGPRP